MALAAILSGSILIFCARMIAGRLSGYVLLVLLVTTPYYALHLRRAMGESLLLLGIALVIVTGYGAVRSWHAEMRRSERAPERANFVLAKPLMWLLLFALASGLAGATKLNGLALVGAGIALCMVLYWKSRTRLSYGQAMVFLAAGLLLLPTLTAAAFTVVNPFLYPHPVDNFRKMLSHRVTSIQEQQAQFPDATIAMRDIRTRVRVIPRKILNLASPLKNTIAVKLLGILAIVGLAVLVWHAAGWWRDGWIRDGEKSGLSVVLLLVAVVTIGPRPAHPVGLGPLLPAAGGVCVIVRGGGGRRNRHPPSEVWDCAQGSCCCPLTTSTRQDRHNRVDVAVGAGAAVAAIVGQSLGAGDVDRARRAGWGAVR